MQTKVQAKFFPAFADHSLPELPPDLVERVTLILAGIDPSYQNTQAPEKQVALRSPQRQKSLSDLQQDSSVPKVSRSKTLADDHRYLLLPNYSLGKQQFAELWQQAKVISGNQDSTVLIKQVNWLKKVDLTEPDRAFVKPRDLEYADTCIDLAPKILFYLYHHAARKVDEEAAKPAPLIPPPNLLDKAFKLLGVSRHPTIRPIYFSERALAHTETYLATSLKLGLVLRIRKASRRRKMA